MKSFLKKANRGLLLTAIVFIAMVIYVSADYIIFHSQKDTINQTVIDYFDTVYNSNSNNVSRDEHINDIKKIVNNYWSNDAGSAAFGYYSTKSTMMQTLNRAINEENSKFGSSNTEYNITNISIKKAGPSIASVAVQYKATVVGYSDAYILTPGDLIQLGSYDENTKYDNNGNIISVTSPENSKLSTFEYSAEAEIVLTYKNKKWKISNWNGYITQSSFDTASEE